MKHNFQKNKKFTNTYEIHRNVKEENPINKKMPKCNKFINNPKTKIET
jgi:hypothetical protein